jgi:putative membrane protein
MTMRDKNWSESLAVGLACGLAATWVMTQFQSRTQKWMQGSSEKKDTESERKSKQQQSQDKPATVQAARKIYSRMLGRDLPEERENTAGQIMHYGFGSDMGMTYATLSRLTGRSGVTAGVVYGTLVWLVADEAGVPALGLSDAPWKSPLKSHVYALASHLVYGAALGLLSQLAERVLESTEETIRRRQAAEDLRQAA